MPKDIKKIILSSLARRNEIKVADIVKATGFSRAYVSRFFKELKDKGQIALIGKANNARYVLAARANGAKKEIIVVKRILKNNRLSEDVVLGEIKNNSGIFNNLSKNVVSIVDYAFTEMLNNAIEHSRSKKIIILINKNNNKITFEVLDSGIGIFRNIMDKRKLKNEMEAIQDLLKGKQTTAPKEHTGEGIFFVSKLADKLIIRGSGKKLIFDNEIGDVFVKNSPKIKGTKVNFEISISPAKKMDKVFKEYSGNVFGFSKTKITVDLYKMDNSYISRSQARRILAGLEKFKTIILDFKKVDTVGQGFADEVFRVWKRNHPGIEIQWRNANENITFTIKKSNFLP